MLLLVITPTTGGIVRRASVKYEIYQNLESLHPVIVLLSPRIYPWDFVQHEPLQTDSTVYFILKAYQTAKSVTKF
jgi:hypothetical protein